MEWHCAYAGRYFVWPVFKIPNPKHQIPNNYQIPRANDASVKQIKSLNFLVVELVIGDCLEFVI
jgi:hypothetical protein